MSMSGMWLGSIVSVDCGDVLGVFEGEISNVDGLNQTISLINVSRNSVKCQVPEVTLSTLDIKHLKLIESTAKKESMNNKTMNSGSTAATATPSVPRNGSNANSQVIEDNQKKKGDNKKKGRKGPEAKKWKDRDEACFNEPVDKEVLDIDFDFEKNLALFDKRAVFEEIDALCKSDHIRLVDCNRRGETKYRHDENILASDLPILKQISVPGTCNKEYVTDTGLVVPSVNVELKKLLYEKGEEAGQLPKVRIEMIGRAACEMVLHLVGGSHRLNPQNTHQRPTVAILCGSHVQGAQGVNCGRHLANHCAIVTILCPLQTTDSFLSSELKLFNLSCGKTVNAVSDLPSTVDIIVDALQSHNDSVPEATPLIASARHWAKQTRSPSLCLDPPPNVNCPSHNFILAPGLPFGFKNDKCSVHICDIGLPSGVFSKAGCTYSSPFGSKFVVPLYPRTGDS